MDCPVCGTHTDAEIKSFFESENNQWSRAFGIGKVFNYLLRCTRCTSGILFIWAYREMIRGGQGISSIAVFPLPTTAFKTDALGHDAIPPAILKDLEQAELAFAAGAHYGAGLLLRRACQSICLDKQVPPNGLKGQIKKLAASGVITATLAELADSIRIIGNELAHPDANTPSVITEDDVTAGAEFLTQLVRAIYVDPAKAQQLKTALGKKGVKLN